MTHLKPDNGIGHQRCLDCRDSALSVSTMSNTLGPADVPEPDEDFQQNSQFKKSGDPIAETPAF